MWGRVWDGKSSSHVQHVKKEFGPEEDIVNNFSIASNREYFGKRASTINHRRFINSDSALPQLWLRVYPPSTYAAQIKKGFVGLS